MTNKIGLDNNTLIALSGDLREEIRPVLNELKEKIQTENFEELSKWYMKKGGSRDKIASDIANVIVEKMMNCLPQNYIQFAIEKIRIEALGQKQGVTFDVSYNLDPIKFYVEFIIRISGQYVTSGRVRFEINTDGIFKDLKFQQQKGTEKDFVLEILKQILEYLL